MATASARHILVESEVVCNDLKAKIASGETTFVTQYSLNYLEDVDLIKFDFLGLRTLTVIQEAVELIKKFQNVEIDIATIPMDDPAVYKLFADGLTIGLFQFESTGMREYLKKTQANCS